MSKYWKQKRSESFMINEDRVKELYRMAVFDEYEEKNSRQAGEYTQWDFVGKELVKSVFSGTYAFVLLVGFILLGNIDAFTRWINTIALETVGPYVIIGYAAFMIVYLLITIFIYAVRYQQGKRRMRAYARHLKRARKLLRREEGH